MLRILYGLIGGLGAILVWGLAYPFIDHDTFKEGCRYLLIGGPIVGLFWASYRWFKAECFAKCITLLIAIPFCIKILVLSIHYYYAYDVFPVYISFWLLGLFSIAGIVYSIYQCVVTEIAAYDNFSRRTSPVYRQKLEEQENKFRAAIPFDENNMKNTFEDFPSKPENQETIEEHNLRLAKSRPVKVHSRKK